MTNFETVSYGKGVTQTLLADLIEENNFLFNSIRLFFGPILDMYNMAHTLMAQ